MADPTNPPIPTIIDIKTSFLRTQILHLSAPLRPSPHPPPAPPSKPRSSRRQREEEAERERERIEEMLRDGIVEEVMMKVNALVKKHNKLVYGPQAQRHVAEQVDRLFWVKSEGGVQGGTGMTGEDWAVRGADFTSDKIITLLPTSFASDAPSNEKMQQFSTLQQRLASLSEQRKELREKVVRYKAFRGMLGEFEDVGENIQGNLVGRNGEVERELERMKLLMVRVERGVGVLGHKDDRGEAREGEGEGMDVDEEGDGKLVGLLGGV